ncbi:uncharacterized protein LOC143230285 isoform X2 [Tachypleus tridentatus]|uniref:uncharacterized protein LOC143230285 isoform X2 n=1 Tax=Tachypleus tridentatus TaxID=6853 RepID=UPI003FD3925B
MLIRTEFFRPKYSLVEKPGKLQWNFVGLVCLNVKLYMSDISRILLLESEVAYHISTYRHIWYDILPVDQSTVIEVPNGNGDMKMAVMSNNSKPELKRRTSGFCRYEWHSVIHWGFSLGCWRRCSIFCIVSFL